MNAKMIEGLKAIQSGITMILESQVTEGTTKAENKVVNFPTLPKKGENVEAEKETVTGTFDKAQLDGMTYNDLKKLAKEVGIPAVGARAQLTEKILATSVSADVGVEEESVKGSVKGSVKKATIGKGAKALVKTPVVEEEVEVEEEEEDPVIAQVNEAVAEMTTEEIATFLTESGISAKGKREALIAKVVKAVQDGVIELDGDEEVSEETEEVETDVEEDEDDSMVNDPSNPDMTEERKEALEAFAKSTRAEIKSKEVTRKDMVEFLQDYFDTDDDMKQWKDKEIADEYINVASKMIDDGGEIVEEGAYSVNGVAYCCGKPLGLDEENNTYVCSHCGSEYEAE